MKKRRGLTLIEVIISLAIVGIIAMVFLSSFTSGIKNIFSTKRSTKDFYEIEEKIDRKIKEVEDIKYIDPDEPIIIEVMIEDEPIKVPGKLIEVERDEFQITTFVPYQESSKLEED